jgi:hypothetical protein
MSQRDLARAAGNAEIESGRRQPPWPLLCRILAGADSTPTVRLAEYDDHDDVSDATRAAMSAEQRAAEDAAQDSWAASLHPVEASGMRR